MQNVQKHDSYSFSKAWTPETFLDLLQVWSFILISWPVVVFIILAIIRLKFPPEPQPNCYLAPRNLPSAGFFPFLQTVLCDSDARCKGTPYTPEDLLPRLNDISSLRLKRRSSSTVAKANHPSPWSAEVPKTRNASLAFGDLVSHGEKTLRNISSPSNLTSSINMFNKILSFGKSQTQYSTAGNLKVILCEVLSRYTAHPGLTEEKMAANIHRTFCFTDSSLLESFTQEFRSQLSQVQHNPQYQAAFVNEMVSFLMLVSQVQNDTSLWHLLLLAPDVFQGSMQLQDIIDFLQNPSSVVLAAQNVSASLVTDDGFETVQKGVTDPPYSLNCLEQDKEKSLVTRYICNHFVNWKDNRSLVSELEEVLRKIKSQEIGGKDSKRSINSDDLEAIQKSLHRLKGFEKKMNRSELKSLNLFRNLKNETLQKLYAILELGMYPHHDYKLKEPYNKEIIDEIYNFTSLQLQSDFNGTSIFNIMTQWKEIQSALKLATMIWNPVLLNNSNFSTGQTKDALKMLLSTSMPSSLEDFRDRLKGMQEIPSLFADYLLKLVSYRNVLDQLLALQKMVFIMTDTNIGYQYLLMPVFELMREVESSMGETWWDELNAYWRLGEKLRSMKWNNTGIIAYGQFLEVLSSHLQKLNNNSNSVFSEQLDQLSEFITAVFKEFGENSEVANISVVTQAIQKTLYILKDLQMNYNVSKLKSIDLFFNFDNKTLETLSEILRTGMKILHYTSAREASGKEIIDPVYNLTHYLLQEFSESSLQHNTSLEAKIWEFLHSVLSPFLENSDDVYRTSQNCSARDVLHITLEMLFENTTLSESLAASPCKPLFDSMDTESGTMPNDTFTKIFQLAITNLKLSPEFAAIYENSSERFSKELSCVIQSLQFSLSFLSKLNLASELENSWVQEKARALGALMEELLQSNASCPIPVQDVGSVLPSQLLDMLIPFTLNETVLNSLNFSDSSADWHRLPVFSHLLPTVTTRNSSIYELLQVGRNASNQSEWGHFSQLWHATGSMLTTKWNLTEVDEYVKLLEIMKKALILVDFGVAPGKTLVYQIFHNSSGGIKFSEQNDLYSSLKLFFNSTSATNSTLDLGRMFQEILPLYEVGSEDLFYPNPYGKENQDVLTMAAVIWNQIILTRPHFNTEKAWEVIKMIALHAISLEDIEDYLSTNEKVSSLFSDFLLTPVTSENFAEQLLSLEQLLAALAKVNTSDHYLLISSLSKLMQKLQNSLHGRQGNELGAFWQIAEVLQSMNWNSTESLTSQSLLNMLQNQFSAMKNYSSPHFSKELKQLINMASSIFELYGEEDSRGTNISIYSQAMQRSIFILKSLQKSFNISELETVNLLFDFYSNSTQRLIEVWRAGRKVLHDTKSNKTFEEKMDIVYNFSHLLLQKEFSESSLQHNTSLEAKIWEFLHSVLSPFLENSDDVYRTSQNCSARDVLHITLEMLFENTTLSESLAASPCKPLFDSMDTESGTMPNDTFTKMFQLAITNLKLSPEFAAIYENSSERFSKELSCVIQSLQFSLSFLSKLNLASKLENSWVQEKARALSALMEELLQSNASCPIPVQDAGGVLPSQLLDMLIPFMLNETVLNSLNFPDSLAGWNNMSVLFNMAQDELHMNDLLQRLQGAFNLTKWSYYSSVWNVVDGLLNTERNLTDVAAFAKLLEVVANNSANDVSALEFIEASSYVLKGLNSDLINEFNISSILAFLSNKTSFDNVIDVVAHHFVVMAETLYNKTLPWTHSDQTLSPTRLITRFLFLEFENTILQVTVNSSYNPYLMCLINATEVEDSKLTENITLLLKQAHLKKNPFMQNDTSEKHSSIPELLKLKISHLRHLTTLLCDYESFQSIQQICHLPNVSFGELCEQSQSHEQLLRAIELSNQVVTNVLNHRRISQELQNLLIGDVTNFQTQMKWFHENVPEIAFFQEIPQYMTALNSMLNITENLTDSSKQEKLRDVFKNVDQLKEDLKNTTGMSTASIDALLEAPLPENSSQLISQILQLESCSVRPADPQLQTVAEEFCNLSLPERTRETYILGVTLLRHLDIYNFLYKMFFPKELQKSVDEMLDLLTKMKYFRHQVESGVDPLLQAIHSLKKLRQSRNVPLTKALFKPNNFKVTRGTFKSMSKVLCNQEITPLFFESLLPDFGDPVSNSSSAEDVYVQKMMKKYGIPHDSTPFCLSFYLDLVKTPTGALIWSFLKPMVLGKILYTPDTIGTRAIMERSNATLKQMADLALKSQEWLDKSPVIMNSLTKLNQTVPMIKNTLQNPFVQVFIKLMVDLDAAELLSQINELDDIRLELQNNADIVDQLNTLATLAVNVSSCVSFNRVQAVRNLEEMEMVAKELFLKNELFASIIFKLPSSHSSPGRSVPGDSPLPPVLNYTIRMSSRITQTTNRIRERIWTVGPHNSTSQSQIYSRAFIYIQDSIERAIIELQTGKKPEEIAVQVQAMPYPCYNKDMFLTSVTYSLPFALMAAWVLFIADFVKTLVQEKDLRLYEYMKMMGVNASSHFIAWFIECAVFLLITVTFLIIVLKLGDILPKTNTALLFLYLMDYSLSIIAMSYFISVFFNNTNIAALVGSLVYILTFFPFIVLLVIENHLSFSVKSLLSLLSPTAFSYASQYIARYEAQGIGLQWDNMYKSPMIGDNTSFGWMCWLILIDSFIYFILGWYIRNVFPGRYGMAAPWYFPLLPSYWVEYNSYLPFWKEKRKGLLFTKLMLKKEATLSNKICAPPPHLEPEPTDLTLGVSLRGITKIYGSKAAVDNLSLNFYEGNITSLLGHNGAGKTTTISILTGLFPTSSGTIFVYGKDIKTDQEVIRKNMGVCMQHNVLFNYLTTKEHLLLYGYIKVPHWSKQELYQEVKRTLKETGLYSHRHKLAGSLSGGMKRKLSIAIALLGGSRVVILDEPTTGVDPCSRRSIWEIISKNKKGRTIILSTHHLDEAEVLSDRIAFLEHGGLKCCGSPFYLKETFGDGYHLTLTKKKNMVEECDTAAVTSLIQSHLPEAYLKEDIGGELVYVLPPFKSTVSGAYQALLRALDTSLSDLSLGCYGISNTTVEEVFLNLTKELGKDQQEDAELPQQLPGASDQIGSDETSMSTDTFTERDDQLLIRSKSLQGLPLLLKKTSALFIKRFHHTRRDVRGFIAQVILPVLFVMAAMGLGTLRTKETEYPELMLSPSLYGTSDQADFFGNFNETTDALVASMLAFPGTDNTCMNESNSQCLKEDMLGPWIISGNQRTKYSACNCTDGIQTCPQTNYTPPHRRTFSTRTVYNLTGHNVETYILATTKDFLQKRYGGWSFGLPLTTDLRFDIRPVPPNRTLTKVWYNPEGYHSLPAYLNSLNNFILRANLPKNETSRYGIFLSAHPYPGGQSQEQVMLNSLLDIIVSMSVLVGYSITTASFVLYVVKEHQTKAKQLQHISGLGMTSYWVTNFVYDLVLFMVPIGLSIGVISSFQIPAFCNNNNLLAVFLLLLLFGYATFSWMYLLAGFFKETGMAFIVYVCVNLFFGINTIITHSVVFLLSQEKATDQGLRDLAENLRHAFLLFPQFCFGYGLIELSQDQALLGFLKAYGVDYPDKTFELDKTTSKLFAMFIQGTVFFVIRLTVHDRMIQRVWNNILQFLFDRVHGKASLLPPAAEEDGDVQAERNRVESGKADFDVVQLQNLTKIYHLPHKRIVAVKNISLGIPAGECFGLLGVNGAGKTTIFKMLTGDIGASSGKLRVQDHSGSLNDISEAHWSLFGYCPQEDALDDLLTVEEHMYYYARLHGIPERDIKGVVLQLLYRLNLMAYKDRVTSMCSYGTNRKLSTALALIGNPSILLLDEPSSGMDPNAKRHLWKIISEEVQNKCSVILTSHSMEECEALCTRLAIMVNGSFQCIGSLQHIKSRFGRGFTVKMHLNSNTVNTEMLTEFMKSHFPNTCLKDRHFNMVEYHVPVSAGGVANIFDLLEASKAAFDIRHFSVSQTTLEEVFINFAKDQADPDGADADPDVTLDSSETSSQDSTMSSIY
ncbi:glucosylceramide transporter ABCA12 isoform X2 [Rissa tridactyla]|uniref:glucosylceramide transporter ABCA12 isoform X2 n=1 Tax=Rissa tridactyla TaxID=75485 RepID=UPI0023BAB409|nr:glucosylceramide transporter ABCA12 isoform X2 [Rissa tridactyla]XP_054065520.1 glucosylceramide transporter ABCA12 isoform X2 [Rissa tridactyla]XP_054065521.1 glucosylceramide transporter ABCA12 isoform X2 [Rissa tridactyla]XP_054065522.1 glucosylceramide transporter ABCA12 isoform X2 [Rissa tridactyla]